MIFKLKKDYFIEGQLIEAGTRLLVEMPHIALDHESPIKYVDVEVEMYNTFEQLMDHLASMLRGEPFTYKTGHVEQLSREKVQELIAELEVHPVMPLMIKNKFGGDKVEDFYQLIRSFL